MTLGNDLVSRRSRALMIYLSNVAGEKWKIDQTVQKDSDSDSYNRTWACGRHEQGH